VLALQQTLGTTQRAALDAPDEYAIGAAVLSAVCRSHYCSVKSSVRAAIGQSERTAFWAPHAAAFRKPYCTAFYKAFTSAHLAAQRSTQL
jgi:hypothetical protein